MKKNESGSPPPMRIGGSIRNPDVQREPRDVNVQALMLYALALIVTVVIVGVVGWKVLSYLNAADVRSEPAPYPVQASAPEQLPPEPRLQGLPGHPNLPNKDLRQMLETDTAALSTYGWVDPASGIARIPIAEAMKRIATQGLPNVPSGTAANVTASSMPKTPQSQRKLNRK